MYAAQTVIECRNCGGGGRIGFCAGVAIAALALIISAREHREFMRQATARARFNFTFKVVNYDTDLPARCIEHEAASIRPVVSLRLDNGGTRAASETLLNVLAPRALEGFRWCGPNGEENIQPRMKPAGDTHVELRDRSGALVPAQYLDQEIPRVPRKGGTFSWFCFILPLPDDGSEVVVPLRALVQADEIPDEIDEYEGLFEVCARRVRDLAISRE